MTVSSRESTFVQPVPAIALYFASDGQGTGGVISRTIAYLPAQAMTAPITMSQSWEQGGYYVFLGEPVWDLASFIKALQAFLQQENQSDVRFIWIQNPNQGVASWNISTIKLGKPAGNSAEIKDLDLRFRNLALIAGKGSVLSINLSDHHFEINNPANGGSQIALTTTVNQSAQTIGVSGTPIKLPFYGQQEAGCLRFALTLTEGDLDKLDVGLRFFMDAIPAPTEGSGKAALTSKRYPLFSLQGSPLTLYPRLDPCHPLDGTQTYFSFTDGTASPAPVLVSYYLTTLGHAVTLTPQPLARLIFTVNSSGLTANPADPVYVVPQGEFEIGVQKSSGSITAHQILCGLSGLEYIGLPPANVPALLQFVPDQSAYAPGFSGSSPSSSFRLSTLATTSWVYLLAEPLTYYAQPDGAALYQKEEAKEFLGFMQIPGGILPQFNSDAGNSDNAPSHVFPMVPYAGLSSALDDYRRFELQILSPERRNRIYQITQAQSPPGQPPKPIRPVLTMAATATHRTASPLVAPTVATPAKSSLGTTPQGLLATFSPDLQTWQTLTLAQDSSGNKLTLSNIANPLKAALQTNQQFLVISNPDALSHHFIANRINVAGWIFDLDPGQWSTHGTILIFKFYADKSVGDLVQDIQLWVHPDDFNQTPATTQQTIQAFLDQARCQYNPSTCKPPQQGVEGDSNYEHFVREVVENKNWNGILVLNCRALITGFPPELEGLAAGIEPAQFYAHHFGIELSPVRSSATGQLEMGSSSFFGLIDYDNSTPLTTSASYDYQVDHLGVLLKNSQIKALSSTIKLTINELFNAPATLPSEAGCLTLHGSYESHNGQPAYTFIGTDDKVFSITSPILDTVEITKVQFATVIPKLGLQPGEPVQSRFILKGKLGFKPQGKGEEAFDLLSYTKLPFANLALTMNFDPQDPQGSKDFSLDESQLTLNSSDSEVRPSSLAQQFPLKATGFKVGTDKTPADLGYLSVKTPTLFTGLSKRWYGITYELNLGSMGALAPKESFTATLLVAWSPEASSDEESWMDKAPSPTSYPIAVGIKLPFSGGGKKELSLQGILKLAIGAIELSKPEQSYILTFKKIALKFLIVSLPPKGSTDMYLFGNPDTRNPTLAWYAAYQKEQKTTSNQNK